MSTKQNIYCKAYKIEKQLTKTDSNFSSHTKDMNNKKDNLKYWNVKANHIKTHSKVVKVPNISNQKY